MDDGRDTLRELREPELGKHDLHRLREIFSELAWHGDTYQLLQRRGVDEGELAQACDVIVRILDVKIIDRLRAQAAASSAPG